MKKWMKTFSLTATVLSSFVAISTHADEVEQTLPPIENSNKSEDTLVNQTMLDTAKNNVNLASVEVTVQESKYNDIEKSTLEAQNKVSTLTDEYQKAEDLANSIRPESIEEAKSTVSSVKKTLVAYETEIQNVENTISSAKNKVSEQVKVVETVQSDLEQKKSTLEQAQANENKAKLDAEASIDNYVVAVETARTNEVKATENLKNAQKTLEDEKVKDSSRAELISKAEKAVALAQSELETAKLEVEASKIAVNSATAQLTNNQSALQKLIDEKSSRNTITFTQSYIDALKAYTKGDTSQVATLKAINKENLALNTYKENNADKNHIINDINNLTDEEIKSINEFALDLSQQIRNQFGSASAETSVGVVKFANRIAELYKEDVLSGTYVYPEDSSTSEFYKQYKSKHDTIALNTAAKEFGLLHTDNNRGNFYENMTTYTSYIDVANNINVPIKPPTTLNDIKESVYKTFISFMLNGGEWDHANSVAGLRTKDRAQVALSITYVPGYLSYHFITVPVSDLYIKTSAYDKTIIPTTVTSADKLDKEIASLTNLISTDTANLTTAKNTLAVKEANVSDKESALRLSKEALLKLQNQDSSLTRAQENFTKAQNELSLSQKALELANTELNNFYNELQTRKAKYESAKKETLSAQEEHKKILEKLALEKSNLLSLQSSVTTSEEYLSSVKERYKESLTTYQINQEFLEKLIVTADRTNVEDLKVKLEQAKADLKAKREQKLLEKDKLDVLIDDRDEKVTIYNNLLAKFTHQQPKETDKKINVVVADDKSKVIPSQKENVIFTDKKDNSSHFEKSSKNNTMISDTSQNQTLTTSNSREVNYSRMERHLPNTGEASSKFALSFILMSLGFSGLMLKTKKDN